MDTPRQMKRIHAWRCSNTTTCMSDSGSAWGIRVSMPCCAWMRSRLAGRSEEYTGMPLRSPRISLRPLWRHHNTCPLRKTKTVKYHVWLAKSSSSTKDYIYWAEIRGVLNINSLGIVNVVHTRKSYGNWLRQEILPFHIGQIWLSELLNWQGPYW